MSDLYDDTARTAWLAERRKGLGGSDIAAVLALSPWTSPWALWADKTGLLRDRDEPTEAMEFGTRAERMLAEWFTARTGLHVAGEQTHCTHPDEAWMRCTVDGFVFEHAQEASIDNAIAVAEWKTTSESAAEWAEQVPTHYACQATWTSMITGIPVVWFGVLHLAFGRPTFRTYEFRPDAEDMELLRKRAHTFWHDHVLAGVPPDTDGHPSTTAALRDAFPGDPDADQIAADDDALRAQVHIASNKARIKACEATIAEYENVIRAALGDHTELVGPPDAKGKPTVVATWKPGERRSIDAAALRAAHADIAEQFTKTTPTRTLLVKAPKEQ